MSSENLASVLFKAQDMRFVKKDIPEIKQDEVLLKVASVGICGSDVHYWWKGRTGRFVVESPIILGHEASAMVVQCGPEVKNLKKEDRVAIEPGVPCRRCELCKIGKYNVCHQVKFCATPPVNGTLCQYYSHPADFCFRLPDHVTDEEGAMLEPLSVAVYSCRRAEVSAGSKVLILGAGPIGVVSLLTAKSMGASSIAMTDINNNRLDFAKKMGAKSLINVLNKTSEEVSEEIIQQMEGRPTAIIECCGVEDSYKIGLLAGAPRSIMVTVGRGPYDVNVPIERAIIKEMEIRGIFRYANCYEAALEMVASKRVDLKPLVTHRFSFEQVEEAFQAAKEGTAIKVMIRVAE